MEMNYCICATNVIEMEKGYEIKSVFEKKFWFPVNRIYLFL